MAMYETDAFAMHSAESKFEKIKIKRGVLGPGDVEFDIKFCGICHSDVHMVEGTFIPVDYPIVPGHELAGIVTKVRYRDISY